mmetsp:Transcript_556/g.1702  ORF Transcript_556/g.1702 Transcript_556/m.1702 type:complete len:302 (+) Transcript_556:623-1528(+)
MSAAADRPSQHLDGARCHLQRAGRYALGNQAPEPQDCAAAEQEQDSDAQACHHGRVGNALSARRRDIVRILLRKGLVASHVGRGHDGECRRKRAGGRRWGRGEAPLVGSGGERWWWFGGGRSRDEQHAAVSDVRRQWPPEGVGDLVARWLGELAHAQLREVSECAGHRAPERLSMHEELLQVGEFPELGRQRAGEAVPLQAEHSKLTEPPDARRDRARHLVFRCQPGAERAETRGRDVIRDPPGEHVAVNVQVLQGGDAQQVGEGPVKLVPAQIQPLQQGQGRQRRRQRASQPVVAKLEHG